METSEKFPKPVLARARTATSDLDDEPMESAKKPPTASAGSGFGRREKQERTETPVETTSTSSSYPSRGEFNWENVELGRFWVKCFPRGYNVYVMDGLHPKALCSKICNDVLRTNININSGSANPNDKLLCFEVLSNLEQKFTEAGIILPPTQKPGGTPNQQVYKRVLHTDFNRFSTVLGEVSLGEWARERVEESIRRLTQKGRE